MSTTWKVILTVLVLSAITFSGCELIMKKVEISELKAAQKQAVEKQRKASKVKVAQDAIAILETKVEAVQKRTGGNQLCKLVLSDDNISPEVLRYRLTSGENCDSVLKDAIRAIKLMVILEQIVASNYPASTVQIVDACEQQLAHPSASVKEECNKTVEKIEADLREIEQG